MYVAARHPLRPSFDLTAGRDLLSFGFGHSMAQIGTLLSQQGDNLVVGRWLGANALGIYGRAYNLMVMPATAFGKIVNRVLFPVMAQVQDERDRLAERVRALARDRRAHEPAAQRVPLGGGTGVDSGHARARLGRGRAAVPAVHRSACSSG